jgi:hypothetical protein
MSGGSKTKTTSNEQATQQTQLPAWLTGAGQSLFGQAQSASNANPIAQYGGRITPDLAANQRGAITRAQSTQGMGQDQLASAQQMTAQAAGGTVNPIAGGVFDNAAAEQYRNPFTEQVQQRTLAEMTRQNTMQRQDLRDGIQGAGAYGGTRQAVAEAEQGKAQNLNMLDYLAQSNAGSFEDAAARFNADRGARIQAESINNSNQQTLLDRLLSAGGQTANIAGASRDFNNSDINNLLQTGAIDQATAGDALGADYNEYLRLQNAPIDRYAQLIEILNGVPRNVTTNTTASGTSTSKQKGNLVNTLLGGAQIAASAFGGGAG